MPSKSTAQQALMAIAEHHPEKVKAKNRGVLKMTHKELHDFAATPKKGLPKHKIARAKKPAKRITPKRSAKSNFWG